MLGPILVNTLDIKDSRMNASTARIAAGLGATTVALAASVTLATPAAQAKTAGIEDGNYTFGVAGMAGTAASNATVKNNKITIQNSAGTHTEYIHETSNGGYVDWNGSRYTFGKDGKDYYAGNQYTMGLPTGKDFLKKK